MDNSKQDKNTQIDEKGKVNSLLNLLKERYN